MKGRAGFIPAIIAILAVLGGCMNFLESSGGGGPALAGKGRVEIRIADNARTALPSAAFDKYVLRFVYTGTEGYAHDPAEWSAGLSVDLEPGVWTVILDAYTGTAVSGTGSAEVTVSAGTVTPVTIRIGLNTATAVKGTLKYKVSYPAAGPDHAYGTQVLTVRDTGGSPVGSPEALTNGAERSVQLDPGVYFVGVVINDTVQQTGAARTSAVHIYGGQETSLDITIGEEEFTALVPVTVTAGLTIPGTIMVWRRSVVLYGDPLCTDILAVAPVEALFGQAEVTLWAPSSKVGVRAYIRQEVVIDMAAPPLGGHLEGIPMSVAGAEVSFDDTLYTISPDGGITHGTVTSPLPAAFEGYSVGVTVEPDADYALRAGSPEYSYDGAGYPLAGSGPDYTFVMPAFDVTMSAEFDLILYTVSIPSLSNGNVLADQTSAPRGATITVTVAPNTGFALKAGSLTYRYDGADYPIAGSGPNYTFEMPAFDVTVSASFNRSLGFTIEGPQNKKITIITTHSTGGDSTDISWTGNETVTFMVAGYSAEAGNLKWFVSENETSAAGHSLTISASNYIERSYTVTVMIKADGQWYSAEIPFKVTR